MGWSEESKRAMVEGRAQARVIDRYLEGLATRGDGRSRRSPQRLEERLEELDAAIPASSGLKRLGLIQERMSLDAELAGMGESLDDLEADFVKVVESYSERKGITYQAWRAVGVPARVLAEAGLRTRRYRQA